MDLLLLRSFAKRFARRKFRKGGGGAPCFPRADHKGDIDKDSAKASSSALLAFLDPEKRALILICAGRLVMTIAACAMMLQAVMAQKAC